MEIFVVALLFCKLQDSPCTLDNTVLDIRTSFASHYENEPCNEFLKDQLEFRRDEINNELKKTTDTSLFTYAYYCTKVSESK